jgi:hypothetical protein
VISIPGELVRSDSTGLSLWQRAALRSAVLRKGGDCARQLPRAIVRLRAREEDYRRLPPVLANSFPKSGTNLLLQILGGFASRSYGSFLASMPSVTFRERSFSTHLRLIDRIAPGEALGAHLFYDPAYAESLTQKNVAHFFIYRDPRDVAVSDAHYLTYMNRWHRMHGYFARTLKTDDERLSVAILGVREPDFRYDYPDLAQRFARYRGWLGRDDVFAVRFEDLVSSRRAEVVHRMATFYAARCAGSVDVDALARHAVAAIDGRRSHTFRRGQVGSWRHTMTDQHLAQVEQVAGGLLAELGY